MIGQIDPQNATGKAEIRCTRHTGDFADKIKMEAWFDRQSKQMWLKFPQKDSEIPMHIVIHQEDLVKVMAYSRAYKPYFVLLEDATRKNVYNFKNTEGFDLQIDFLANEAINDKITILRKYINEKDLI